MKVDNTDVADYQRAIAMLKNGSLDIAVRKLQLLSENGDGHADGVLGTLYECGVGHIQANVFKALSLYEQSVLKSDSLESWMGVGRLTLQGPTEVRDYRRAFECFSYVAENCDYPPAWLALGNMHMRGLGREVDLDAATRCFQKAADLGNVLGYPGLATIALKKGRVLESLKYRAIGAMKGLREPEDSEALRRW